MYFRVFCLSLLIAGQLAWSGRAQETPEYTLIKAGHLLDVQSGKVLRDQEILIRGERIEQVGTISRLPSGTRVIDLSHAFVSPGLIDAHTHLTVDAEGPDEFLSLPREALVGVRNARTTLNAGFTAVRNLGTYGYVDVALRDGINDGDVPGPRMQVSGPYIGMTGGHCDTNDFPPEMNHREPSIVDGPWAVRSKVREVAKYGADLIKICATGGVFSKGDQPGTAEYTLEEIQAAVQEAHKLGRKVAAHAHGAEGIKNAIRGGVDSIEHASLIDDEGIRMAKKAGTFLVMDVYNDTYILEQGAKGNISEMYLEKERQLGQTQRDNFQKAFKAGVRMAFGSDAGVYPHGDNWKQFAYMVQYGMSPMQALRAATVHAAELMGWQDRIGSLAPGKFADLIAVQGDPLVDVNVLEKVTFVMKNGQVVKNVSGF